MEPKHVRKTSKSGRLKTFLIFQTRKKNQQSRQIKFNFEFSKLIFRFKKEERHKNEENVATQG